MPAILRQVSKNNTIEQLRQTFNLLGQDLYNIQAGTGSITANKFIALDGSSTSPTFTFTNDLSSGLYRSGTHSIGIVANEKRVIDYNPYESKQYSNLTFRKQQIATISVNDPGSGYTDGSYSDIVLFGGSGNGALANIVVSGNQLQSITLVDGGIGYFAGDILTPDTSVFVVGSGGEFIVNTISESTVITADVETGNISLNDLTANDISFVNGSSAGSLTIDTLTTTNFSTDTLNSNNNLDLDVTGSLQINSSSVGIGSTILISPTTGDIITSGDLRCGTSVIVGDNITITGTTISTVGENLTISPGTNKITRVTGTTAFVIPAGSTGQRPSSPNLYDGSIRFNTDTKQYEGYSAASSSWSSLGGVRDIDGNTYIIAEATVGANDDTLYFYNNAKNSLKVKESSLDFFNAKTIISSNPLANSYVSWQATTTVTINARLRYNNNVYRVALGGTTSSNPPTHTSGTQLNGSAQLEWESFAFGAVIFDKISEVTVGNTESVPFVFGGKLKILSNTISTITDDNVILSPYPGRRVKVDAKTSLVLPVGTTLERGNPETGSIRYNSSITAFEGYNGTQWTGLGGVKDVDGNTYILPELTAGSNDNTFFFFNDGDNTLKLTKTSLVFYSMNSISSNSDELDINTSVLNLANSNLNIDSTDIASTKITASKNNLILSLLSNSFEDPFITFNNSGETLVNTEFSEGSTSNVKLFDKNLKYLGLQDIKIETADLTLIKDNVDSSSVTLFNSGIASGCKVTVMAYIPVSGKKEMTEFNIIEKNGNVYHNEYGSVMTDDNIIDNVLTSQLNGDVTLDISLNTSLSSLTSVSVTIIKTIINK